MARKDMTYIEACHAMQSGVAYDQASGSKDGNPKHLRVGINSVSALAELLIEKEIIKRDEYLEAVRVAMVEEVERYEDRLSRHYGKTITLG